MDNLDLLSLNAPDRVAQASGAPMQLPLDLVDEDPDQPRVEFDTEELQELADSIKERGVIAPISVRPHPKQEGRWIVNFGARRLRASKLAGRNLIPAFVDHGFNSYDQVAYFSDRGRLFQADRGRRNGAVGDALGKRASSGLNISQSSTISLKRAVVEPVMGLGSGFVDFYVKAPARPPEAPRAGMYSCSLS